MMFWIATITLSKGQKQKTPTISDGGCFTGGPSVSRTQHQRILVCVAFTTPWTMPSPYQS